MKKYIASICILFLLTVFSNAFSQTNRDETRDALVKKNISLYRQHFWDSLPKPGGWINDYENIFTNEEESQLLYLLNKLEWETSNEIYIVTVDTFSVTRRKFDELALHVFETWQPGKKDKDNGILILISKSYKSLRILNGGGIEKFIDQQTVQNLIDNVFLPGFKREMYYDTTLKGISKW